MPKITGSDNSRFILKPISTLKEVENTRKNFSENSIIELAESIETRGQKQPIVINSNDEIQAGYRRFYAFKHLVSQGKDFTMIECVIDNDDFLLTNLTENIQKEDLTGEDLEYAVLKLMKAKNLKQKDVAKLLKKSEQWVSDILSARKTRDRLKESGIKTDNLPSSVLSILRSLDDKDLILAEKHLSENGATANNAKKIVREKKNKPEKSPKKTPVEKIEVEIKKMIKNGVDKGEILDLINKIMEGLRL